jgi:hypothetical protein
MQRAPFHTFRKISFNLAPSMKTTYSAIYLDRRFVVPQIAQRTCAAKTMQSPGDAIDAVTKNAPFGFGGRQYRAAFRR